MSHLKDDSNGSPEISALLDGSTTQRLHIVDNDDTLEALDCKPNHASNTNVYVCFAVTVSERDTEGRLLRLRVGTETADRAGNALASVYDHASQLTLDGHGPAITFPSGAPTVGASATITLTDATSKVAKYAVREVDGAATDATGCDDPSASGDNFSTTAVDPVASPKEVSYTPVAAGKKVCVYAEDAAGNSHSSLWPTAIAANAAPSFTSSDTANVAENSTAVHTVAATDADSGDSVTGYAITGGADRTKFSIVASTGVLTFKVAPDYEDPQDALSATPSNEAGNNEYVLVVTVTSGAGSRERTATQTITVTVTNVDEAGTVTFDSTTPTVGTALTASVSDPDGNVSSVTWQWSKSSTQGGTYANISAATAAAYTPAAADEGKWLRATASYTDGQGSGKSAVATATAAVAVADTTPPTVTAASTGYFSDAAAMTALTGPLKSGADIYTKVTFSENMKHVKNDGPSARPELFIHISPADSQYDIVDNGDSLATGDCKPNHATNTNVYICRYTVEARDNGEFTVKVGTNSQDTAGNALAAVYTHTATLTLDTADPGITFPPSWTPTTGVAATIALSDAGAIKKYGAIVVDGSTGTAANCDTASEVGTDNLTTLSTPLVLVNYSYTPPSDSAGKKVCVYAEDAAGNSHSSLWSTAIAANAAPSFTSADTANVAENSTAVITVAATDADSGDSVTGYAITGGADRTKFSIGETTGVLTFKSAPDYEDPQDAQSVTPSNVAGNNEYVLVVTVTSGAGSRARTATQTIVVTVTDENEPPSAPTGLSVSAIDGSSTSLRATWTAPTDTGRPAITGYGVQYRAGTSGDWTSHTHSGTATTADITGLSPDTSYQVQVRATNAEGDGAWTASASGTTNVAPNVAPVFTSAATFSAAENQTAVGTVAATDANSGDSVTYEIAAVAGGVDGALFAIGETTGVLTFKSAPDFENPQDALSETPSNAATNNEYVLVVTATGGAGARAKTATQAITVTVTNVDEAGSVTFDSASPAQGSALTATLADPDGSVSGLTWAWTRLDSADASTGTALTGATGSGLASSYTPVAADVGKWLRATASYTDGHGGSKTAAAVTAAAVAAQPKVSLVLGATTIAESGSGNSTTLKATLPAAVGSSVTVTVTASLSAAVTLSSSTLTIAANATESTTPITITAVDNDVDGADAAVTLSATVDNTAVAAPDAVTLTVTDDDSSPVFSPASVTRQVAENTAAGGSVGAALPEATDADGDTLTYTLGGTDAASFVLEASTRQLKVGSDTSLDFEAKSSYTVTVTASDGNANSGELSVTVTVTNVDEAGAVTFDSDAPRAATALTATLADPDGSISGESWAWTRLDSADASTGTAITGATAASYTPVAADVGKWLRATASYTDGHGASKTAAAVTAAAVVAVIVLDPDAIPEDAEFIPTKSDGTPMFTHNQKFRLLFVTKGTIAGTSSNIADYNKLVQDEAAADDDLAAISGQFYALASTTVTNAKVNTLTRESSGNREADPDAPIWWVGGPKATDDNAGLFGGESKRWGLTSNGRGKHPDGTPTSDSHEVWTGTTQAGAGGRQFALGHTAGRAFRGRVAATQPQLNAGATSTSSTLSVYGLSRVLTVVDSTAPTVSTVAVTSDAGSDDTYGTGEAIEVTVTFSEAVTVTGSPQLAVKVGAGERQAAYASGSGTAALVFSYTVAAGDADTDGIEVEQNKLALNGGTIKDTAGNAAVLTHSALAAQASHKVDAANRSPAFDDGATTTRSIAENSAADTAVGAAVAATDAEGDTLVYALGGTDADSFAIDTATGQIKVKAALDYETKNSYSVSVTVHDGKAADNSADTTTDDTIAVTISVTNVDEDGSVTFGSDAPRAATALTATLADPDGSVSGLTWAWTRLDSADASTGTALTGATGSGLASSYTPVAADVGKWLRASASYTDGQGSGKSATATAAAVAAAAATNAAPTFTSSASFNAAENQTAVGTVAASDADAADSVTGYAITGGADRTSFSITSSGGVLTFNTAPDFENPTDAASTNPSNAATNNEYVVVVTATSGAGARAMTATQTIVVTVTDVSEPPTAPTGLSVSAIDGSSTSLRASWTAPTDTGRPAITGYGVQYRAGTSGDWTSHTHSGTGVTADITGLSPGTAYQVQVRATNAEGNSAWTASASGTTNAAANAAPSFTSAATASVAENSTAVITVVATDTDSQDSVTYAITGGADQSKFSITSSGGALTFNTAPDFENPTDAASTNPSNAATNNEYVVVVTATSGAGARAMTATQTIVVTVTDVSEPPTAPTGLSVSAIDGSSTSLRASWTAPTDTGRPAITGYGVQYRAGTSGDWTSHTHSGTGVTADITGLSPGTSYQVQVRATNAEGDGPWTASASGTTNTAPNSAPTFTSAATASVAENSTAVITVAATDADAADSVTGYAITGGADRTKFSIGETTGVLTFQTAPDFENPTDAASATPSNAAANNEYLLVVTATSGAGARAMTATQDIAVTVTNVDEAGTVTLDSATPTVGTALTASVSDPDGRVSSVTWQWSKSSTQGGTYANISSATSASYTPATGDAGAWLRATASYTDGQGSGKSAVATAAAAVAVADTTAPTVKSVSHRQLEGTMLGADLTGPQKAGVDIYTLIVFSENMKHTKSDDASARPELFYRIGATDTQYDILDETDTLAWGDCYPYSVPGKTDIYLCLYTVAEADDGAFAVKVGTNSQDRAGNALAATFTSQKTLTLDNTGPEIAFPSGVTPTLGIASTITLTDAGSKVKKYGAIVVDGSTGAATDCDTASEIGAGNLTTLATPLASVGYSYTPPANSVGKKVCAYAEDALGHSDSSLWGTAIVAPPIPAKPAGFNAAPGHALVELAWTDPSDSTITRYQYQQKAGSGSYGAWTDIPGSGAATVVHRVTGLDNGTAYGFRIRAVNASGNGAQSDEATATPLQGAIWTATLTAG